VRRLDDDIATAARRVAHLAVQARLSLATAESLTAGLVCAALAGVPGVSVVLRGGVVSYTNQVKSDVLGVDPSILEERGAVCEPVAEQMVEGVRRLLGADVAVATTGVAGPGPSEGVSAGTVLVAVSGPGDRPPAVCRLSLEGDRARVRAEATLAALSLLVSRLEDT